MCRPALRPERSERWRRSDDHHRASGGSRVKADAGAAGGYALKPACPDTGSPPSDRRPGSPLDQSSQNRRSAASTRSRVPLRRKRPAGTQGSGDIDKPSAVTERAPSLGDHALSEIDAPGPHLTPACGGRTRRPRTEEWTLPDHHPRSRRQLGALDPRSPITEEGSTTVSGSRAGLTAAQPPQNRTCRFPRIRLKHRPAHARSTAGTVRDGTSGGRERGSHLRWRGRDVPRYWYGRPARGLDRRPRCRPRTGPPAVAAGGRDGSVRLRAPTAACGDFPSSGAGSRRRAGRAVTSTRYDTGLL
jgi:hypothetical protein